MYRISSGDGLPLSGNLNNNTFFWVECHLPVLLPSGQRVEILLQGDCIILICDGSAKETVICKKASI